MGDRDPVIIGGARTGIGRLLGSLAGFSATDLGGFAIKGALDRAGSRAGPGRVRDHGPRAAGGHRADHRPAGGGQGGHPDDHPGDRGQQGLPVRPRRDRPGGRPDQARRVRRHRGGRHGVDDQRAARAQELPQGLQVRRGRDARLDGARRADRRRSTASRWASRPTVQREARHLPRATRTSSPPARSSAPPGPPRTACSPRRSSPVEIRSQAGDDRLQGRTRASAATRRAESLAKLRPAFGADGTITAGTSSQISDGAAAVIVTSRQKAGAARRDHPRRGRRVRHRRGPGQRPALPAVERDQAGARPRPASTVGDLDLIEINEAFAAVGIASMRDARRQARHRERERRRDRGRPPARRVGHPDRAHAHLRAAPPRRRARRGGAVRRRRPGLGPAAARAPLRDFLAGSREPCVRSLKKDLKSFGPNARVAPRHRFTQA